MPTQKQRADATRELLLNAFRRSLLDHGLEATTTSNVLKQTGLSKGAMYHHFPSKNAVIEAIYRTDSHGAIQRSLDAASELLPPIDRLKQACENWLVEMGKDEVGRIVLGLGPQALGLERVIAIESELSLKLFEAILEEANQQGGLALPDARLAARLVNAVMTELAQVKPSGSKEAVAKVAPLIDGVLTGLSSVAKTA